MRVLVTGAAGFVGRRLVPRLEAEGAEVSGVDLEVDVADPRAVEQAVGGFAPDALIHLAAISSVARSRNEADLTYRVNFLGSRCVFEAVRARAPRARVLLVGSGDVYGTAAPGAPAFAESAPLRPDSPYARAKACADLLGGHHARHGLDVVRVRSFSHSGPGQADAFVASSFARQLAEIAAGRREAALRVGNLESVRDFLDVDDVIDAYLRLLSPRVPAGVYNVASGRGWRIGDLLDRLIELAGVAPEVEVDASRVRPTDHSVGEATRLREATGWQPRIDFGDTLARLLDDWRARVSAS